MIPAICTWIIWKRETQCGLGWIISEQGFTEKKKLDPRMSWLDREKGKVEILGLRIWRNHRLDWSRDRVGSPSWFRKSLPKPQCLREWNLTKEQPAQSQVNFLQRMRKQLGFHSVNNKSFLEKLKSQFRSILRVASRDKWQGASFSYKDLLQLLPPSVH